tara:strand:+ start:384 stop:833 length:450 start_codon:yes stop_codon:yes gene_type:complete
MSHHSIQLTWELGAKEFSPEQYNTDHNILYNSKTIIKGGSSPDYGGDVNNINPEQNLAAAMSSCHMMTFLAIAAKMKWPIVAYRDTAIAYLGKNSKGKISVNKIELNPKITFGNNFSISDEEMKKMKDRSHRYCFIANSLSEEVEIIIN